MDKLILLGQFFGYPQCCVNEFVGNFVPYWERAEIVQLTMEGGFIPCPACAAKILSKEITIEGLIQNRICTVPFHQSKTEQGDHQLNKEVDIFLEKRLK